jgi:PBSX family phage terminase large subunit
MSTRPLTPKQRAFADAVISGKNYADAYRAAYDTSRMKAATVSRRGSELMHDGRISAIVDEGRRHAREQAGWSLKKFLERAEAVNDLAYKEMRDNGLASNAANTASKTFFDSADRLNRYSGVDREAEAPDDAPDGLPPIDTASLVPACYSDAWRDIMAHGHSEYIGESGRGSLKSTVLLAEAPLMLMLKDPHLCGVGFRRVGNTLRDSVFAGFVSAIRRMGLEREFEWGVQPMEIRRPSTGQVIMFRGLDDPEKAKSLTLQRPDQYIGFACWEEFDQNKGERAVRVVEQTIKRGAAPKFWTFRAFNTPADPEHWAHLYAARREAEGAALVLRSTYLDVPREFLGEEFYRDAERLKAVSEEAYRNEYLGESVGLTGRVFDNVVARDLGPEDVASLKWSRCGIDWGFASDPFVWLRVGYDRKKAELYVFDELYNVKALDETNVSEVKRRLAERDEEGRPLPLEDGSPDFREGRPENECRADAAGAKDIATWRHFGVNVMGASKRVPVADGIKWLAKRRAIYIDRRKCPLAYQEFSRYRAMEDEDGRFLGYPDKDNHAIDAVRYAVFDLIADPDIV